MQRTLLLPAFLLLATLNAAFFANLWQHGILLSYKGFEYIDDNQFYSVDASLSSSIFYKNRQADAVDVYFVNSYIPSAGQGPI